MGIIGKEQDYEGESDARTLSSAHEVRRDKKRHTKALKHLKKMSKSNSHHEDTHAFEKSHGATTNAEASPTDGGEY